MRTTDPRGRRLSARPTIAWLLVAAASLGACGPSPEAAGDGDEAPLATEEIPPPFDEAIDPTDDEREVRAPEAESGVLPSGFPDLPRYPGATIVDLGPGRSVTFLAPEPPTRVGPAYRQILAARGWRVADDDDGFVVEKNGEEATLRITADGPSTRIVVRY